MLPKAIRKAVIPAAGLGTRVLPASKAVPKEMLPLVDKPVIQYLVEEVAAAGIEELLIITNRGKSTIEDHFDRSPELEARLEASGKNALLAEMRAISQLVKISYVRQQEMKGLGHAIGCAEAFAAGEPFAVLYGDDVVLGENATAELCAAYERYGKGVLGVKEVPAAQLARYSSVRTTELLAEHCYAVDDMIEKPRPTEAFSNYAILGRCILPAEIFEILRHTPPGAGGEIQLTDAMKVLAQKEGMVAVEYSGQRYDMGNKMGILSAIIDAGLCHPEVGEPLREYILQTAARLK